MTRRYNLMWTAKQGILPGGPRHKRLDIHFSAFPPWDPRYRSTFTNRFSDDGEKGVGLYVPIDLLVEMGARLGTNGVILCRDKVPHTAIHAIFELKGSREMGPRIQSPSLVDEYVCETMQDQDFMNAGERYVMKAADMYKSDINVPFAFRKNIALILQRVQNGVPTEAQAKELINHMTRAIIDSGHNYEGSCRWCPWCLNVVPASIITCLPCNVAWVSPALLIQRSSLKLRRKGWKRSTNVGAELDVEEPELGRRCITSDWSR